ncbi:protein-export chaperone SecB [Bacillus sp. 1NLA3E]|uniref:protein-export chaperone SecB n=1 Tax=Bacillus sp. 1NLA3E TaxID=666686 RepID=UPI000247F418|nr:protein-export chaperone SecB [Bacillus sp. 1NLA3E]AGK52056.1 hypothetical protein B1NLA3E_01360 [Bacillus sp. 1NLA3E]
MNTYDYYKLAFNSIQLEKAHLEKMKCINRGLDGIEDNQLEIKLTRKIDLIDDSRAAIRLKAIVGFEEEGPFLFDIVYYGECVLCDKSQKEKFEEYSYDQIVPLLLPYVRECVSSTLARMELPIFTIPIIDVIGSIEENKDNNSLNKE